MLSDQNRIVDDEIAAARVQLSFVESIATGYAKEAWKESVSGTADPATWQQAFSFLGSGAMTARASVREGEIRKRGIAKQIDALNRELRQIATGRKSTYEVRVAVSTPSPIAADIRLTYRTGGAFWRPRYEFRLDSETRLLDIIQSADVSQNTGENWADVALALSTSRPSGNIAAPEITPYFIGFEQPRANQLSRPEEALDQMVVTGSRVAREGFSSAPIALDMSEFAATYRIDGYVTLASGATEQSYVLSQEEINVTLKVRSVPKYDPTGYLYASFEYDGQAALRAGNASIFRDGDFVGTYSLGLVRPGEETDLALGRDELIEIKYEYDGGEMSDSGIFNRTQREDEWYLIEVTNRHASPIDVEIIDQWPVPTDEDIDVKPLDSATPPTEADKEGEPGIIYWRDNLAAGETMTIRHHYRISYPEGKMLSEN